MAAKVFDIKLGMIAGVLGSATIHFLAPNEPVSVAAAASPTSSEVKDSTRDCQVLCSVTGPHYNTSGGGQTVGNLSYSYMESAAIDEKGSINVQITGISEQSYESDGMSEVQLAYMLRCALLPFIFIEKYKGCFFQVACVVRGEIRPSRCLDTLINCCGLALLNACVEMRDVVTAVTAKIEANNQESESNSNSSSSSSSSGSSSSSSSSSKSNSNNNNSKFSISMSSDMDISNSNNSNSSMSTQITSFATLCYSTHLKSVTLLHTSGVISESDLITHLSGALIDRCNDLRSSYRVLLRPEKK